MDSLAGIVWVLGLPFFPILFLDLHPAASLYGAILVMADHMGVTFALTVLSICKLIANGFNLLYFYGQSIFKRSRQPYVWYGLGSVLILCLSSYPLVMAHLAKSASRELYSAALQQQAAQWLASLDCEEIRRRVGTVQEYMQDEVLVSVEYQFDITKVTLIDAEGRFARAEKQMYMCGPDYQAPPIID